MSYRVNHVIRYLAECTTGDCTWRQEHVRKENAVRDAERHVAEWHDEPALDETPRVVDLMAALEASLEAVKRDRPLVEFS